ncbi:TPR repeat [Desulfurella amilsii]|uniref:TPR repeat n=1 Tax=Desulfurella amilsii TaxID=1562698 RepID=A0A1X4XVK7_9BACT|nr:tetratricopeptide repeat protein [Desulfurella amilsii]OSS41569.1 TPR repeat [Desulfurella amilsii]
MKRFILAIGVIFLILTSSSYAQELSNLAKSMVYSNQAQNYYDQNQFQQAIDDYTKAIQESPNNYMAYINRGIIFFELNRYDEALKNFKKARTIDPKNAYTYYNSAIVYTKMASTALENDNTYLFYKKAKDELTKAIQNDPNFYKAYINRGLVNYELAFYQDAIDDFTKAIQLKPLDYKAYYNRGIVYYTLANFKVAKSDFTNAIEINPDDANAYFNRGLVYKHENSQKGAASDFYTAGLLYVKENNRKEAYECVDLIKATDEFSTLIYDLKSKIIKDEVYGA